MTGQPAALRAFEGAVAVITGGASGIGKSLAEALAERGCEVIVADLQTELAEETVEELLGKPWHRGEEAAVARLGGQPVEGRHQLLPVRAAQQPEPDRRAVGEAMSRAVVSGEAHRVTVRPFPDS